MLNILVWHSWYASNSPWIYFTFQGSVSFSFLESQMRQDISGASMAVKFRNVSMSVSHLPVHPTRRLPRRSCAEWGKKEAERDSATVRETHKRRSRLRPPRSARPRKPRHRGTGTCWPGPGTVLHWSTGRRRTHPRPFRTLNRNRNSSSLGLCWINWLWNGERKKVALSTWNSTAWFTNSPATYIHIMMWGHIA